MGFSHFDQRRAVRGRKLTARKLFLRKGKHSDVSARSEGKIFEAHDLISPVYSREQPVRVAVVVRCAKNGSFLLSLLSWCWAIVAPDRDRSCARVSHVVPEC